MQVIIEYRVDQNLKKRFYENQVNQIVHNDDNYENRRIKYKMAQSTKKIKKQKILDYRQIRSNNLKLIQVYRLQDDLFIKDVHDDYGDDMKVSGMNICNNFKQIVKVEYMKQTKTFVAYQENIKDIQNTAWQTIPQKFRLYEDETAKEIASLLEDNQFLAAEKYREQIPQLRQLLLNQSDIHNINTLQQMKIYNVNTFEELIQIEENQQQLQGLSESKKINKKITFYSFINLNNQENDSTVKITTFSQPLVQVLGYSEVEFVEFLYKYGIPQVVFLENYKEYIKLFLKKYSIFQQNPQNSVVNHVSLLDKYDKKIPVVEIMESSPYIFNYSNQYAVIPTRIIYDNIQ